MEERHLIGALEAGGTKMVCATGFTDGSIVACESIPTTAPDEPVAAICHGCVNRGASSVGIGSFGPTAVNPASPDYCRILETPKTAWRHYNLLGTLKGALGVHCGYDTDVNVACLGEVTFGCARGLSDVVYLTVGTGVGAGVMTGGRLLHGMMHPEAGHVLVEPDPRDPIADHGACPYHAHCLEGYIAGPACAKRWGGKRASELADDPKAMDILAGYLGQALVDYILCYSPAKIIIGGGVADHTPLVPLARAKAGELLAGYIATPEVADLDSYIVCNSLGGNQGIMGCLELGRRALANLS